MSLWQHIPYATPELALEKSRREGGEKLDRPRASVKQATRLSKHYARTTDIERQAYDEECLRTLFEGCPKLREVPIASQKTCMRQLDANRVFASAMTQPEGDRYWWTENVHQTLSVAMAANLSGRSFDSLTLAAISPAIFDKHVSVEVDQWRALKTLVQPLRRLRLYLQADAPDEEEEEEPYDLEPDYEQISAVRKLSKDS